MLVKDYYSEGKNVITIWKKKNTTLSVTITDTCNSLGGVG